ncbi:hypothetical protein ACJMK2_009490 [Sinanodonta woodiana]|uniref:Mitochondrial nucleoid factor 1 n=1 Tax=Sinanodonta woodiana TaxID=1069815 RepID=A0ABD3VE25_SINWO
MSAMRYRQFMRLLEEWPVDKSKAGRNIAELIRKKVADGFRQGEHTTVDFEKCDRAFESLQKINTDFYKKKYFREAKKGATGLDAAMCSYVTSNEGIKQMNEENKGMIGRLLGKIRKK